MKKTMCMMLAVLLTLLLGGCWSNPSDPSCFPDGQGVKLSASKEEMVRSLNLVWTSGDGERHMDTYQPEGNPLTVIAGFRVSSTYTFLWDRFWVASYCVEDVKSNEEIEKAAQQLKSHFSSLYGQPEPADPEWEDVSATIYGAWKYKDEQGGLFYIKIVSFPPLFEGGCSDLTVSVAWIEPPERQQSS
ncbi:MAG: hypothetical protein HFE85_03170 [Clostridiales bacterium]|nr:hypothetical protein [Clostridiales bacterium]